MHLCMRAFNDSSRQEPRSRSYKPAKQQHKQTTLFSIMPKCQKPKRYLCAPFRTKRLFAHRRTLILETLFVSVIVS